MRWITCLVAAMALAATGASATVTIGFNDPSHYQSSTYVESGFSMGPVSLIGPGYYMLPPSFPIPETSVFTSVGLAVLRSLDGTLFKLDSIDVAPEFLPSRVHGYALVLNYYPSQFTTTGEMTLYSAPYPDKLGWSTITLPDVKAAEVVFAGLICGVGCGGDPAFIDNLVISPEQGVAPVPEPSTWILAVFGFAAIGALLRRSARATLRGSA